MVTRGGGGLKIAFFAMTSFLNGPLRTSGNPYLEASIKLFENRNELQVHNYWFLLILAYLNFSYKNS